MSIGHYSNNSFGSTFMNMTELGSGGMPSLVNDETQMNPTLPVTENKISYHDLATFQDQLRKDMTPENAYPETGSQYFSMQTNQPQPNQPQPNQFKQVRFNSQPEIMIIPPDIEESPLPPGTTPLHEKSPHQNGISTSYIVVGVLVVLIIFAIILYFCWGKEPPSESSNVEFKSLPSAGGSTFGAMTDVNSLNFL